MEMETKEPRCPRNKLWQLLIARLGLKRRSTPIDEGAPPEPRAAAVALRRGDSSLALIFSVQASQRLEDLPSNLVKIFTQTPTQSSGFYFLKSPPQTFIFASNRCS